MNGPYMKGMSERVPHIMDRSDWSLYEGYGFLICWIGMKDMSKRIPHMMDSSEWSLYERYE